MEITKTLYVTDRAAWRQWLAEHHATESEIWLISYGARSGKPRVDYLDAVKEALCFGWIDGIAKKMDAERTAQRFTPRRSKSHWTELNKERARGLIAAGAMTPAGLAVLPDLSPSAFCVAPDIAAALQADPQTWQNFEHFPDLYKRIRIGFIEEVRRQPREFQKRLAYFLKKTRENKLYGTLE
jgi:uncharacterized protein YdeI (YjbR/CyaY-like superfamily)